MGVPRPRGLFQQQLIQIHSNLFCYVCWPVACLMMMPAVTLSADAVSAQCELLLLLLLLANCTVLLLHIHWSRHVTNAEISARTGLPPVMDFTRRRRLSVFGHIARLTQGTPAHNALHCQVGLASGRSLGRDWRRVVLVILALAGQTNSATTLDLFLPTSGDRPSYGAMVERRDGPSWLRDDDDDDD